MSVKQSDYEILLSEYSNRKGAIALLKQYRPYLEMLPSIRRPEESLLSIPLPVVRIKNWISPSAHNSFNTGGPPYASPSVETINLPCDLAILMCDPEWKIKMGVEIFVFIHRPDEDFSAILSRWRQTQIFLDKDYEWLMPIQAEHMFSEKAEKICPLFIVFTDTPERIKRGLIGASLPFVLQTSQLLTQEETEVFSVQDR